MVMATSFKRTYASAVVFRAPDPTAGHCRPMPLPETPGHSQASLAQSVVGSLLLSPGSWCTRGFVCAHQEFISQSCVSFGGSMVVLMATSSKRAYAYPGLLYSEPLPLWQSTADSYLHRRHSQFSLRLYGDSGICLIG